MGLYNLTSDFYSFSDENVEATLAPSFLEQVSAVLLVTNVSFSAVNGFVSKRRLVIHEEFGIDIEGGRNMSHWKYSLFVKQGNPIAMLSFEYWL